MTMNIVPARPKAPVANSNGTEVKAVCHKRALSQEDSDGASDALSKNKQKKKARNPHKNFCPEQKRELFFLVVLQLPRLSTQSN